MADSGGPGYATRITIRGDGHYGRPEDMEWCDENGVDFIFGLPGNHHLARGVPIGRWVEITPPR